MKCKKCGAEIKAGNLYCSRCGAEVQIVSAYNVMEDEFFLDFQNRQMRKRRTQSMPDAAAVLQKKKLYICILTAIVGFLALVAAAFLVRMNISKETVSNESKRYTQMIQALVESNDGDAIMCLEQGILESPKDLENRFWMAWLYGRQGNQSKKIETLQQILSIDGENIYACKEMIRVYVEADDFEALHEFYDRCSGSSLAVLFEDYLVEEPVIEMPQEPMWDGDMLTIQTNEDINVNYTMD